MTGRASSWDDYLIPGTDVLRNLATSDRHPHGIPDQQLLTRFEERAAAIRSVQLSQHPIAGSFDVAHLGAIHRHLFQDVYPWAGQLRTAPTDGFMLKIAPDVVNFQRGDPRAPEIGYPYYPAQFIAPELSQTLGQLRAEGHLKNLDHEHFVDRLALHWNELNVIHPFREGNTRTQLHFFNQLTTQAGWKLDVATLARDEGVRREFIDARFYGQLAGPSRLAQVLSPLVVEPNKPALSAEERQRRIRAQFAAGTGTSPLGPGAGSAAPRAATTPSRAPQRGPGLER